jgi:hypothetical protein
MIFKKGAVAYEDDKAQWPIRQAWDLQPKTQ